MAASRPLLAVVARVLCPYLAGLQLPEARHAEVENHAVGSLELELAFGTNFVFHTEGGTHLRTHDAAGRLHLVDRAVDVVDLEAEVVQAHIAFALLDAGRLGVGETEHG